MSASRRDVALAVRRLAMRRGLPLSHLADLGGIAHTTFWRLLDATTDHSPRLSTLVAVADHLDVDVIELVSGEPPDAVIDRRVHPNRLRGRVAAANICRLASEQGTQRMRLAIGAGIGPTTLWRFLDVNGKGPSDPQLSTIEALASQLGVTVAELLTPHRPSEDVTW